jgi:YNFM family putative membrane transporter
VFFVYRIGVVVTPLSGILMGRIGFRNSLLLATTSVAVGAVLTLVPNLVVVMLGLALSSSGAFVSQASASGYVSQVGGASTHCDEDPAEREARRTSALGIYLSCYYFGGSCGAAVPGFFWRLGGWPACVALLLAVQAFNLVLVGARFKGNATAAEKRVG